MATARTTTRSSTPAILATIRSIFSCMGDATQSNAAPCKNDAANQQD